MNAGTVEQWAQCIVHSATGAPVVVHDDRSRPSMYDLRVGEETAPEVAIEATGAVDPTFTETWNTGPAGGPLSMQLRGDWAVQIQPGTYVRKIAPQLETLLQLMESEDEANHRPPHRPCTASAQPVGL